MGFKIVGYNTDNTTDTKNPSSMGYSDAFGKAEIKEHESSDAAPKSNTAIKNGTTVTEDFSGSLKNDFSESVKNDSSKPTVKLGKTASKENFKRETEVSKNNKQYDSVDAIKNSASLFTKDLERKKLGKDPKNSNQGSVFSKFVFKAKDKITSILANLSSSGIEKSIKKQFEHGRNASTQDIKFRITPKAAMLLEYSGDSSVLRLPNAIFKRPLTALNPGFITGNALVNLHKIKLPLYVEVLPRNLFDGAKGIDVIVVQDHATSILPGAFNGICPKIIYFLGNAPDGIAFAGISKNTVIACKRKYAASYRGLSNVKVIN